MMGKILMNESVIFQTGTGKNLGFVSEDLSSFSNTDLQDSLGQATLSKASYF